MIALTPEARCEILEGRVSSLREELTSLTMTCREAVQAAQLIADRADVLEDAVGLLICVVLDQDEGFALEDDARADLEEMVARLDGRTPRMDDRAGTAERLKHTLRTALAKLDQVIDKCDEARDENGEPNGG